MSLKITEKIKKPIIQELKNIISDEKITLESYSDYPSGVKNNAQKHPQNKSKTTSMFGSFAKG